MKKLTVFIILILFSHLYAKDSLFSPFYKNFALSVKSNYDIADSFELSGASTLYEKDIDAINTGSFTFEAETKYFLFYLGAGITYQLPTYAKGLGDFSFLPVYGIAKMDFFKYKDAMTFYGIYHMGGSRHHGSYTYSKGADLVSGDYSGYGIGFLFGDYFTLEAMKKTNEGKRLEGGHDIDLKYETYSISIGIKSYVRGYKLKLF